MFRSKRKASDFTSEINAHLQLEIEALAGARSERRPARATARRSFGNLLQVEERFYESHRWLAWDHFWQDARYALRMLRNAPGFTAMAILTIALGIGATTAIFSVVDATLLHPLPYPQPEQLVSIRNDFPGMGAQDVGMSQPEWQDLQRSGIFEPFRQRGSTKIISPAHRNLRASACLSSRQIILRCSREAAGRPRLHPEDHSPGLIPEALISDAFGSEPSGATRISWTRACGLIPTCIASSASCHRVSTRRGARRKKEILKSGPQPVFTARPCRITAAQRPESSDSNRPTQNLD